MKFPSLWICVIVVIVLLSLIVYISTHRRKTNNTVCYFSKSTPKDSYVKLVSEFGSPQVIINQKDGFAMWFPSKTFENSPYESIILKDEDVKGEFLYTTVVVDIPDNKLVGVLSISKSVHYNVENRELTVRGSSNLENKYVLYEILNYVFEKETLKIARKNITWLEYILSYTSFSDTTFSDKIDDDILTLLKRS